MSDPIDYYASPHCKITYDDDKRTLTFVPAESIPSNQWNYSIPWFCKLMQGRSDIIVKKLRTEETDKRIPSGIVIQFRSETTKGESMDVRNNMAECLYILKQLIYGNHVSPEKACIKFHLPTLPRGREHHINLEGKIQAINVNDATETITIRTGSGFPKEKTANIHANLDKVPG